MRAFFKAFGEIGLCSLVALFCATGGAMYALTMSFALYAGFRVRDRLFKGTWYYD